MWSEVERSPTIEIVRKQTLTSMVVYSCIRKSLHSISHIHNQLMEQNIQIAHDFDCAALMLDSSCL